MSRLSKLATAVHLTLRRRAGYFSPSGYESLLVFAAAVAVGLLVYTAKVRGAFISLYDAYLGARVTDDILAPDPAVPPAPPGGVTGEQDLARLFRALQLLKLQGAEDTLEGFDKAPAAIIKEAMNYPTVLNAECKEASFTHTPTAELIVHLVLHVPGAASGQNDNKAYAGQLARLVCALLANQPGAADAFRRAMEAYTTGQGPKPSPTELLARLGPNLGWWNSVVAFSSEDPPPLSNLEIIASLYQLVGVDKVYNPLNPKKASAGQPNEQERLRVLTRFLEGLLEQLRADRQVKHAAKGIPLWRGYEQCAMWVVFFWMVLLLLYREGRRWYVRWNAGRVIRFLEQVNTRYPALEYARRKEAAERINAAYAKVRLFDAEKLFSGKEMAARIARVCGNFLLQAGELARPNVIGFRAYCRQLRAQESGTRWFIRWLALALPAIGFIGTKRGIAGALSQADIIVRAQDPGAQAVAISTVTSILGIAFTTTLIALVMGLITSLINYFQTYRESAMVEELEGMLVPLLEPELTREAARPAGP
jgi:hypothetical protein